MYTQKAKYKQPKGKGKKLFRIHMSMSWTRGVVMVPARQDRTEKVRGMDSTLKSNIE